MIRIAILAAVSAGLMMGQGTMSGDTKTLWGMTKSNAVKSAEKMPEEHYSFKPSPDVRSYGQVIGHMADAMVTFCAATLGEKKQLGAEKGKTAKADLVAAMNEAVAYCDGAYNKLDDKTGAEGLKFFGRDMTKLGVLQFNNMHLYEHYGNLVTYMRLKGIVPPSSSGN